MTNPSDGDAGSTAVPADPAAGGLVALLGLQVLSMSGDAVVMRWSVTRDLLQPAGLLHGGVHCAVVETAASVAAGLWLGERGQVVGVSNSTDFFRSSHAGDVLTATASPLHRGRSQQVWVVEIVDEQGRRVARGQVRLQNLTRPDPAQAG